MLRFILVKIGLLVPTFIGVAIAAFGFVRLLPGDPVLLLAGEHGISPERHAELMHQYGFDQPIWLQFLQFLWHLLQGDLGVSISTKRPVISEFLTLFPATLELSICAIILAVILGIPAGILAATRRGSWIDQTIMGSALVGYSMPIFWWGLLLIILFSGILHWTPVSGRISLMYFFPLAVIARQTRSAMLEVLSEDYVRTARAKGLSPLRVVSVHALRNALIPVITTIGLQVGVLMAGAILTETIFSWPGVGKWMVDSIFRRDYPAVQGGLLLIALIVMVVNLIVDLLYGLVNPRVRHGR